MTVGIYIRVSTEEQATEGYSISAQREKLKAYCQSQGWQGYKFYVDEGISAKDTNRPQLLRMIKHIEDEKIKTVLVYRLDRLTRSVLDLYKLLETFDKHGCTFKSATEVYDTGSAMGRLFITLVAALAQWERENLGERVRMGQIEKARQGEYAAKAPFGFDKDENDKLIPNPKEKKIIMMMATKIKEGYSIRQLSNYMDDMGIPPIRGYKWHIRTILDILQNPALYGAIKWNDEIYEDSHKPIMSQEEFDRLQKVISSRQNHKKRETTSIHIFQGKLICSNCGSRLTCERSRYFRKRDNNYVENNHYRCQVCALNKRQAIMVSEKRMEAAFIEYMAYLTIEEIPDQQDEPDELSEWKKQLRQVERQREKYQRAWANDLMTDDEFAERMKETKKVMDELTKKIGSVSKPEKQTLDKDELLAITNQFKDNWKHLTDERKKEFAERFIEGIQFHKDGVNAVIDNVRFF